jgi:N12 class adenine-specific DNA methylase
MKLKLARASITAKPKSIELSKVEEDLEKRSIFYFDKENSHKDLKSLIEHFEEMDYSVYMREVKFGLNDDDFIYEVHIVK